MRIYAIDLSDGLSLSSGQRHAVREEVTCIPFQALIDGMLHDDVR
ncbi:hypothetical protein DSUL_30025 [Desulfovibrionales bacterium]